MQNNIRNVSLSFCCKKDWNTFQTTEEHKRFCNSCRHNVTDFTKATQPELDSALKRGERVCGRFTAAQLSDTFRKYAASAVVAAGAVLSTSCENAADIKPSDKVVLPTSIEPPTIEVHEFVTMGIVAMSPDSAVVVDTVQVATDHN